MYEVSSRGRVRSYHSGGPVILSCSMSTNGYVQVQLRGRERRTARVHALVAEAFLGERQPGMEVNHKDANKTNNSITNLEWVTKSENMRHAVRIGSLVPHKAFGEDHKGAKLTQAQADRIYELYASEPRSVASLAAEHGVGSSTIKRVLLGKSYNPGGRPPLPIRYGRAKLSQRQVAELRREYDTGQFTLAQLGRKYGMDQSMISLIGRRKTYANFS